MGVFTNPLIGVLGKMIAVTLLSGIECKQIRVEHNCLFIVYEMCDVLSCQQTFGCKANRSQRVTANTVAHCHAILDTCETILDTILDI